MISEKRYYEAYDDRYKQVHEKNLRWFSNCPSAIVGEVLERFGIATAASILEIGCGEGRDAAHLLARGYRVLATDISPEAIACCKEDYQDYAEHFQVLDCIGGYLEENFDFIYAVAVVHMLVPDADRRAFYRFIREHLKPDGIALVCTMGDGETERSSDITVAFDLQERRHDASGQLLQLAGTSCRMVSFDTFLGELEDGGLAVAEHGLTAVEPDFPVMMYAVIKGKS